MRMFLLSALLAEGCLGQAFGSWKMNAARSTFAGAIQPKSLTVRIEPHPKGEVFTLDRSEADGRTTTSSTILYLDSAPRDFEGFDCSGIQSSRRVNRTTVEILRKCAGGQSISLICRTSTRADELILEVTEQQPDGRHVERRLVLERQAEMRGSKETGHETERDANGKRR